MLPFMISQSYDGGINMEYFIFVTLLRKTCIKKGIHKHTDVLKIFTDRELSESIWVFLSLKDYIADGKVTKERIPSLRKLLTLLFNEFEGDYTILGLSSWVHP